MDKIVLVKQEPAAKKGGKPKKIKTYYNICSDVFDLNDQRHMTFKQYLLQAMEHIDEGLFEASYERFRAAFNKGDYSQGLIEMTNFKVALEQKELLTHDACSMCFSLICLDKDEDQMNIDEGPLQEKLNRMRAQGLTRGQVEDAVINFMSASPTSYGDYSQIWPTLIKRMRESS